MPRLLIILLSLSLGSSLLARDLPPLPGDEAYRVLEMLFQYDQDFPLQARTAGIRKSGDVAFEKIVFRSFHDGMVPGLLSVPTNGDGPFPVVLLLHGITADKSHWLENAFTHGGEVSRGLLSKGFAVLALDAQYHGDRAVYNDFIDPGEMVFQRKWGIRYSNLMVQTIVDYRRAIDYLETRPDIDAGRVGVLGYSMGGHMAFQLGALESRVKAIVACVVPDTPGMPIAAATFARSMDRAPLLMMMARKDPYYTVQQAQQLYDLVPGKNKELRFFDSGHSLPAAYVGEAVNWLEENL